MAVTAAEELAGPAALYILVGLVGVAMLSVALPHGCLQQAAEHDDAWAPLFMTAVAIPAYATPMTAMVQLASMFQHGNSVGAAFALLALGAGANLGLIAWMMRRCTERGGRPSGSGSWSRWSSAWPMAWTSRCYPHGVEPAGHTHAFDGYCCPFQADEDHAFRLAGELLVEKTAPHERQALVLVALLAAGGLVLKRSGRTEQLEAWLRRQPAAASRYDFVLPAPLLAGAALVVVIGLSIFGCYVYYPPPEEIFEELRIVNTEVVASATSHDWDTAAFWIPVQRDWTRKLQVSMYLRGRGLTRYQRAKADVVLKRLELLEHEIEARRAEEAERLARALHQAYRRLRAAFGDVAQ